ncbi:MAG: CDP-diacylglycerol--serine O-phosphatidyltransferase [Nitrospirae bacterium]|nr:CDP-diacylglycerol--serine O-phosphatidyltransferase [Nitrospirota bacterium]
MKDYRLKDYRRGIYLIPNLLTTGNLFSGFYAVIAVFNADYLRAALAILVAMAFDVLDGKSARLTKTTSRFGVEYDSLADAVSFGVAPGLLIYSWALSSYGRIGWVAAFLFLACGTLRLARFNVQVGSVESKHFVGLPIPAAAGVIASLVVLDHHILRMGTEIKPMLILGLIYALAFLMVSTFHYRSFKDFHLRGRKPFHVLVSAVLVLIILAAEPQILLFVLFAGYALSGVVERPAALFIRKIFKPAAPTPASSVPPAGRSHDT